MLQLAEKPLCVVFNNMIVVSSNKVRNGVDELSGKVGVGVATHEVGRSTEQAFKENRSFLDDNSTVILVCELHHRPMEFVPVRT